MDFFEIEHAMEQFKKIKAKAYNQKTKSYASLAPVQEELKLLLTGLSNVFKKNFHDPRITQVFLMKADLYTLFNAAVEQTPLLPEKLARAIASTIPSIKEYFSAWQGLFKNKIAPFIAGNQYLKNLPIHPNPDRFHIIVKELNPANIILRNAYTQVQAESQAKRTNKEIISFDENDPIIAKRMFDPDDRTNAPGSRLFILGGQHRLYELYKRYLLDKIDGDTLIEAVKES